MRLNTEDTTSEVETAASDFSHEFDNVQRGDGDDWEEESGVERKIKIYDEEYSRNTEFYSTHEPNVLLGALITFVQDKKIDLKLSKNSYKVEVELTSEHGNIVSFVAQVMKVLQPGQEKKLKLVDCGDESSDSDA